MIHDLLNEQLRPHAPELSIARIGPVEAARVDADEQAGAIAARDAPMIVPFDVYDPVHALDHRRSRHAGPGRRVDNQVTFDVRRELRLAGEGALLLDRHADAHSAKGETKDEQRHADALLDGRKHCAAAESGRSAIHHGQTLEKERWGAAASGRARNVCSWQRPRTSGPLGQLPDD